MTGRAVPSEKLDCFTFPDTGRTVQIRKVSTLLRAEVRRQVLKDPAFAEPQPPLSTVDYGDGQIQVPHTGHPTYVQLRADWLQRVAGEVGERLRPLAIRRGVVAEVDPGAVAQVRADMAALGVDLSEYDDAYVYVAFVCIGSEDDWVDLLRAVFERSAPSEAAIQAHMATFRGDVRGEGSVAPEPGPAVGEGGV